MREPLLVRLACTPFEVHRQRWPDIDDVQACRAWLRAVSCEPWFAVVREGSPRLAAAVLWAGTGTEAADGAPDKRIRSVTESLARAVLRAATRAVPFGLAAGVSVARIGPAGARVGSDHDVTVVPDMLWLDHVRRALLGRPDVACALRFSVSDLVQRHGDVLVTSTEHGRARTAVSRPLAALLDAASGGSVPFAEIVRRLDVLHGAGDTMDVVGGAAGRVRRLVGRACELGIVTDNLSSPMTVTDPLGHMLEELRPWAAELEPATVALLAALDQVHAGIDAHNHTGHSRDKNKSTGERKAVLRRETAAAMSAVDAAGRSTLAVHTRVDADVEVPAAVLDEVAAAAGALIRLARHQGQTPAWAQFHTAVWERYGAGCLVPVGDVVHLAAGIGYPAGYPSSARPEPRLAVLPRDEVLARWAWEALHRPDGPGDPDGPGGRQSRGGGAVGEVVVTDAGLAELDRARADSGGRTAQVVTAPHMEIGFRVDARSTADIDAGLFTVAIRPAWTAGVLSGRFLDLLPGSGLAESFRELPTLVEGAIPAQLSFAPIYPHAQNVSRVRRVLPHVITVGEHRPPGNDEHLIHPDDLAVCSTGTRLHLVSLSRRQVVEPIVLHPLALEKQAPPLARFLAMCSRGHTTAWTELDWGPLGTAMPVWPRVSYGRAVLAVARWRLRRADAPGPFTAEWREALRRWARRWGCPQVVELRDGDRGLRLDLAEPLHLRLVHQQLRRDPVAELTEAPDADGTGWIGHVHEFTAAVVPDQPQIPHPRLADAPVLPNRFLRVPGEWTPWVQIAVFTDPADIDHILTHHLGGLLDTLPVGRWWFVRYRSTGEPDHLRVRVSTVVPPGPADPDMGAGAWPDIRRREVPVDVADTVRELLLQWAARLRDAALISRAVVDAYRPEIGRYGDGETLAAAETVFVADSAAVRRALLDLAGHDRRVVCALGMVEIARGLLGDHDGVNTLVAAPVTGPGVGEVTRATVAALHATEPPADHGTGRDGAVANGTGPPALDLAGTPELRRTADARRRALAGYRDALPPDRRAEVLESLLHMHHNRMFGPDRDGERVCRHAARQACRSRRARAAARASTRTTGSEVVR